ncbi:ABC transporter ATP-binding protein/permease [Embleya sp. NBC_00888]|uniref:ABC transporter ATP-binding protein n=1 Tax=Embleya sp. NBC_00888 TaxID=2975960 RepID=UPI00386CCE58|nr:ABC transporter ATP-binding protein/permease [Embleya sp. NBC_00888]
MRSRSQSPSLRLLIASVDRRRARLIAAVLLALVSAASGIVAPLLISRLITAMSRHTGLVPIVLELAACVLAGAFAGGWSAYLLSSVGERAVAEMRIALARHTVRLPLARIRRLGTGEVVSRIGGDAAQLRALTDTGVTALPVSFVMVVAYLIVMAILDWALLLVAVGTFAVASIAIRAFLVGMRKGAQQQQVALGRLAQTAQSVFMIASTVKAFRAEDRAVAPLERQADEAAAAATRSARSQAAISPLMGLGQQIAIVGVLATGGARMTSGTVSVADFVAFLMYLFQLVNPLMTLAQGAGRIQVGKAALARLDEVLGAETEPLDSGRIPEIRRDAPALRLLDVDVVLSGNRVLKQVSLEVPRTGVLALVGPSGAGKSTVLNVIERFVEPVGGHVELLGTALRTWPLTEARRRIALVEQAGTILHATIRENLCLGRNDRPSDEELFAALGAIGLDEVVRAMPAGLESVLGEEVQVSGGELQRLAIARALLTEAEILLMDEPSAHLDGGNEARLVELLQRLGRDRAVLVVAHRMSTVAAARSIVVMDAGRVVGVGDHATLSATCAAYQALARTSGEAEAEADPTPLSTQPA